MVWGTFSFAHIISLIIAVAVNVIIYFILKNKSETAINAIPNLNAIIQNGGIPSKPIFISR